LYGSLWGSMYINIILHYISYFLLFVRFLFIFLFMKLPPPEARKWPKHSLQWIEDKVLYCSIPATWDLPLLLKQFQRTSLLYDSVVVGGPGIYLLPDYFKDLEPYVTVGKYYPGVLQRFNKFATKTTVGCPKNCKFCPVTTVEPEFQCLPDWPDGQLIWDNNLLAAPIEHFDKVIDMLSKYNWSDFAAGLDAQYMDVYHAQRISRLKNCIVRLACDSSKNWDRFYSAVETLLIAGFPKSRIRVFSLVGFNEGIDSDWERCIKIKETKCSVIPTWYHDVSTTERNTVLECQKEWGWNEYERKRIFSYFYYHKGSPYSKTVFDKDIPFKMM
ncbi:MAG TPA: hypothetical protein VMX17_16930, partial [Candidatus Glassbacteria bacterium]|nr:hypothetical protein [Candidatus Glassbacteria bacterium]